MSEAAAPFNPRTVIFIVAAGVLAFAAFLLLIAFAPDARVSHDARAHALSLSGDGYAGLVELTDAMGSHSLIARDEKDTRTRALLIVTPEQASDPAALQRLIAMRNGAPTLIVLPKWATVPLPDHRGWVRAGGFIWARDKPPPLRKIAPDLLAENAPLVRLTVATNTDAPRLARARIGSHPEQQRLAGGGFTPVLLDRDGHVVIGRLDGRPVYVLAEPDLLNNQGLADPWVARQGWRIVDDLSPGNEIAFDVTLNGFTRQRSPLRLVLRPPDLPVTLCIVAAALLAGLHGAIRFGAPLVPGRAIALGKRTLVDNAAMLFRAARKEHRVGGAYAALTRDRAAQATAAPALLSGEALGAWLDRAAPHADDPPYATLAWHADVAEDRDQLLGAARALYRWRRNRTR